MNTRSKTKELIECGEICSNCLGEVDKEFYAAFCQANEVLCSKCFCPDKCDSCNTQIHVVKMVYVLDGMPQCRPLCKECETIEMQY